MVILRTCLKRSLATLFGMIGLGGLLWLPAVVQAATGPQQLEQFLQGLTTLTARFEQVVVDDDHSDAVHARGALYLQRPGRFRWEYQVPRQLIVADGRRVWLYDQELEQISHRNQKDALEGTPALLLSDDAPLNKSFVVTDGGHRDGYAWAELRPRDADSEFTRILLAFSGNELYRMDIADSLGQVTHFRFYQLRRNPVLAPELFEFEPPSGIDVFDE